MQRLLLVRHGQASFASDNYDQLSEQGKKQCEVLGHWLAEQSWCPKQIYSGKLQRHQQSVEALQHHFAASSKYTLDDGLNEFPFHDLLHCYIAQHPDKELVKSWDRNNVASTFKLLRHAITAWQNNTLELNYSGQPVENWSSFTDRVNRAFNHITASHADSLIIASGGSISWYITTILSCPIEQWFELNLQMNNSAVSEVIISKNNTRLVRLNSLSHLDNKEYRHLITHS